jgi:hypothetical protein
LAIASRFPAISFEMSARLALGLGAAPASLPMRTTPLRNACSIVSAWMILLRAAASVALPARAKITSQRAPRSIWA